MPRTIIAPGESCCRSWVASRHPSGITGAIWISTSPPVGFFHRNDQVSSARLAQLEEAGAGLVGRRRSRGRERQAESEREDETPPHRAPLPPAAAAGGGAGFGISIVTVYFSSRRA